MEDPKIRSYNIAWRPLPSQYNGLLWRANSCPYYIALQAGIYLEIILHLYGGPQTTLIIRLRGGL
jgi:hypothetical protein